MKKFNNKAELIEAKAKAMHGANLTHGGVFDSEGNRYSNIKNELGAAAAKTRYVPPALAAMNNGAFGWVIQGFGYAIND